MKTHLEIIRTSREKLIADMERARPLNAPEIPLTSAHAPGFVANVDEDVISACHALATCHLEREMARGRENTIKRAKGQPRADDRPLNGILHDKHSLLQLLAVDLAAVIGVYADGAVLAEDSDGEVEVRGASAQRGLSDIKQLGDILLLPGFHFVEEPLRAGDVGEAVRGGGVEAEEVVGLAAHDDEGGFLGGGEGG